MKFRKGLTLRLIIHCLVISSILFTALICFFSALQVNKDSLHASYLDNNQEYAKKLSYETNDLLITMQKSVGAIAYMASNHSLSEMQSILDGLAEQNRQYFNSMFLADKQGVIRAINPTSVVSMNTRLNSEAVQQAIKLQKPLISEPYHGITNRFILLISSPIFDSKGSYQGFVGGTIYLEEPNVFTRVLNEHFFGNGSYVFVVEKTGNLIFHPDHHRLGESVASNIVVQKALNGESGSQEVVNSEGQPFLAGYSYVPSSGWGIISQTPKQVVTEPVQNLVTKMIKLSIPFFIIILLISWWVALLIARPLHQLATFSEHGLLELKDSESSFPAFKSSIYEVKQLHKRLKRAVTEVNQHVKDLNIEVHTDALTGLANRRTFDLVMDTWVQLNTPFSLILADIDHFKQVNDTYGHLKGDEVLKFVSATMLQIAREKDLCFRYGGEEFGILVQTGDHEIAKEIAERLRRALNPSMSPTGKVITLSIGVATFPIHAQNVNELIMHADAALYQSKANGRNKTTIYAS